MLFLLFCVVVCLFSCKLFFVCIYSDSNCTLDIIENEGMPSVIPRDLNESLLLLLKFLYIAKGKHMIALSQTYRTTAK